MRAKQIRECILAAILAHKPRKAKIEWIYDFAKGWMRHEPPSLEEIKQQLAIMKILNFLEEDSCGNWEIA
jgi:hypothetical protein